MGKIHVLEKQVAERIAAGEVVERPASAVKELLENAVDAGADAVTVEIQHGGVTYIRVTDNGCGVAAEDVPAAFLRHATSKVQNAEDLDAIGTLGFRGEALASIAAVSRCEMLTRTEEALAGTRYALEGGEVTASEDAGCPKGTTILVRDLFFNTPARMKFLKKDTSEANAVRAVTERVALSHPEISFRFLSDGKEGLLTPGDGSLLSAIRAVYGLPFAKDLLAVDYESGGVAVQGYVTKPAAARSNRAMQTFFLNGRFVRSKTAAAALDEAYRRQLMVGKFPACVLALGIAPGLVDVNVHPAKLEVRFSNERSVFEAVYYGVKSALTAQDTRPELAAEEPAAAQHENMRFAPALKADAVDAPALSLFSTARAAYEPVQNQSRAQALPVPAKQPEAGEPPAARAPEPARNDAAAVREEPAPQPPDDMSPPAPAHSYRLLGECFSTYILAESGDDLWVIDKHAAHERILYEELKKAGRTCAQLLLTPVTVALSREEYGAVMENLGLLREAGFAAEDFGGGSVLVREAPMMLRPGDVAPALQELAEALLENRRDAVPSRIERIYHSVACRAALRGGDKNAPQELDVIAKRVLESDDIRYCPHGRPVAYRLTRASLEKQFGRA